MICIERYLEGLFTKGKRKRYYQSSRSNDVLLIKSSRYCIKVYRLFLKQMLFRRHLEDSEESLGADQSHCSIMRAVSIWLEILAVVLPTLTQ